MPEDVYLIGYIILVVVSLLISIRLQNADRVLKMDLVLGIRNFFLGLMMSFVFLSIYFFLDNFDKEVAYFVRFFGLGILVLTYALLIKTGLYAWGLKNIERLVFWFVLLLGEFFLFGPLVIDLSWQEAGQWGLSILVILCFIPLLAKAFIISVELRIVRFLYWGLSGAAAMVGIFLGHCPLVEKDNIWGMALTVFAFSFLLTSLYFKRQSLNS